jgi:phosphatidate cytidylyltransferase
MDPKTWGLVGGVLLLLLGATTAVRVLKRRGEAGLNPAILETLDRRIRAWWLLWAILAAAFYFPPTATVVLFGLISFWALREFITLTPTRPGDHRALFWVFFICTPVQFVLVGMWRYELYSIAIPVYAFLLIPAQIAMSGDYKRFLERTAKIQAGLLICVYCLSYAPALLDPHLKLRSSLGQEAASADSHARLLFFFVLMVQLSDGLQYAWAQLPSKHVITPSVSPGRTWEGLLGGTASVTLIGAVLWWATPFTPWRAAIMAMVTALMGFGGAMTMSAIKRDRGVQDYGTLVEGHGGVLDRIDSICFAAPVFYHLTRSWLVG